jgi:transcriptional regulator with XRE-family HTH domain
MVNRDDLDTLIQDLAEEDPDLLLRVAAALERRELARQLADRRRSAGLTQVEIARRMGTSQGQVTRFESGADTRLSTVARYAAALGVKVDWTITPARRARDSAVRSSGSAPALSSRRRSRRADRALARDEQDRGSLPGRTRAGRTPKS